MKISLYKAAEELRHVLDQLDPETGELSEGYENARGLVANRAQAVAAYIRQNEAEMKMVADHAKELQARVKAQERRNEWLRGYLLSNMQATGITEIKGEGVEIRRYPERDVVVDIFDERQVPAEYFEPQPPKLSKQSIKAVLSGGVDVPGARLVAKDRLSIR